MFPPLRSRSGPRSARPAVWLAVLAVATGCVSSDAPDDGGSPSEASAPVEARAPDEPVDPAVPSFGTDADGLDATVVQLEPADDDDPDAAARIDARVADDDLSRARGLMAVEELPEGTGMLFVYPDERTGAFWMKDTLVPLDIAFVAGDGAVRAVLTMEPCPADPCPVYDPEVEYLAALEVPAGWFAANDIGVGARASWSDPVPADVVED